MTTPVKSLSEQRLSLVEQLIRVQQREDELHKQLFDLVEDEVEFVHYMLRAQRAGAPLPRGFVSENILAFRQRGTDVTGKLQDAHREAMSILEMLRTR